MYGTGYHATGYHATGYYLPGSVVIEPPSGGGGSSGVGMPGQDYFNQSPSVKKNKRSYLAQALQEDEELLIIIKSFVETIRWH